MARCREHDRRAVLLYEDEFELTFDTPEEEPVYEPEKSVGCSGPGAGNHTGRDRSGRTHPGSGTPQCGSGRTGRADPGFGTGTGRRAAAPERGGARKRAHGADLRRRPGHRCCGGPGLLCGGLPRGGAVPQQCRGGGRAGSGAAGHHGRAVRCGQPGQLRAGVPCGGTGAGSGWMCW